MKFMFQMKCLNFMAIDMTPIDSRSPACVNHMLFEFRPNDDDYFIRSIANWDVVKARMFHIKLGEHIFPIPSSYHIMIADSYGEIDWMMVDEMINRDIEVAVLDSKLLSWNLYEPVLVDVEDSVEFHWPMAPLILPCTDGKKTILVSKKDQYHATKELSIDRFLVSV